MIRGLRDEHDMCGQLDIIERYQENHAHQDSDD